MERTEPERTAQQIINSAVPLELTPISRVDMTKLTPVSVNVHTEEDTGSNLIDAQYINIHRVPETLVTKGLVTSTLSGDILSHHVVDLGGPTDFGQHAVSSQYYDTDDLLSQGLNEDDRRLAAALVAVQLVHQQKQQQQQHPTVLTTDLLGTKPITTQLAPVTPVNINKPEMAEMVGLTNCYIQAVENQAAQQQLLEEHQTQDERIMKLYHQPPTSQQEIKLQPLPPLKKVLSSQSMGIRNKYDRPNLGENKAIVQQISVIQEDITSSNKPDVSGIEDELDSDCDVETRSSRRSLPHKKRIPKKLKAPPARNIHAKCYKCNKCGESFTSQAGFSAHRTTHSVPAKRLPAMTSFSCELCNKLFSTQIKFFEHLKSHYEPLQPLPLPSLETQAPSVIALQNVNPQASIQGSFTLKTEDLASVIKEEVVSTSTLPCPQCGKLFRRQKALETHVSVAHPSQEDIEEFSEPEDMMEGIRHVVNIQGTDSGDEDHCDDKIRQWRYGEVQEMGMDLQEMCLGLTTNNDSDSEKSKTRRNKQLSCTICSRAFNHRNSLLYHVRSHSGQRPHQCEVCGKSFFASSALKVHMRLHSGDKPYKCEFCGRHFRQWGDLKYHVTSLHSDQKQFQCEYCGKDFARKYSLIVHRRIHTGEKNYHCEFCNKTFRASSYLQNHRRIHTGEKPHPCDVCGKPFRVRSDMKRHRNTHTGERGHTRRTVSSAEALSEGEEEVAQQATEPETIIPDATPLNLNIRSSDSDDGLSYARGEAIGRDGNTLFVWIPTQNGAILTDE